MGIIKDKNGRDLVNAEEIKMRWKEYTEELYKKYLNELDYYNGMVFNWIYVSLPVLLFTSLCSSAICKASSDNHFGFFSFSWGWFCLLPPVQHGPLSIVLQAHC